MAWPLVGTQPLPKELGNTPWLGGTVGVPGVPRCQLNARGRLGLKLWMAAWPSQGQSRDGLGGCSPCAGLLCSWRRRRLGQPYWLGIWLLRPPGALAAQSWSQRSMPQCPPGTQRQRSRSCSESWQRLPNERRLWPGSWTRPRVSIGSWRRL